MAFLSIFCGALGIILIMFGYMMAFKRTILIYRDKYPEDILSPARHEAIGSDLIILGVIALFTSLSELLIPEFKGRLFYFLIASILVIDPMIIREANHRD